MKIKNEMKNQSVRVGMIFLFVLTMFSWSWGQDHDLEIITAQDITSTNSAMRKSMDIKLGADFGVSTSLDMVQRGVPNQIYARFRINGVRDHEVPSGSIKIKFYWRNATVGSTPPALGHVSWKFINDLSVTYSPTDGPFAITRRWPTDFPSVTNKYINWTAPDSGEYFHIAAELVYPPGITDADLSDNVAFSLYESQSGLLDIVLLHDVSGSMDYFTYGGFTYLEQSKSKASMFLASMPDTHRFSVVSFCGDYPGGFKNVWPAGFPYLRSAITPNKVSAITKIDGLSAQGMTPLGQGLQRAIQILTTPLVPDRKRIILILSDGYENYGTPRACSGLDPIYPCVGGPLLAQLTANKIKVFTVALGTSADKACLKCLATRTEGQWYSSPSANITLAKVYLDVLQAASADDLYRVDKGTSGGNDDTYTTYFEGKDDSLYFILSWDDLEANLELSVRSPRRRRLDTDVFKGKGYHVIKVKNPSKGNWTYKVSGESGKKYLVAVRSDHVGVRLSIDSSSIGIVANPIEIKAQLKDSGKPITNAQLKATIQIPVNNSLPTILLNGTRNIRLEPRRLAVLEPRLRLANPDISPKASLVKKLEHLRREPLLKTREVTVQMEHVGNGLYSGKLSSEYTTIAGEYEITVTSSDEKYHRNFSKQLVLKPGEVDYEKSYAELVKTETPRLERPEWTLHVYAKDKFGNAITDPSLLERVSAEVRGANTAEATIKLGSFQQKLKTYENEQPELEAVILDGRELRIERR